MAEKTVQNRPGEGLGRAIAARRVELGLKRKDLSAATNLSYPYISEIENGMKVPSDKALRKIADALNVDYAQLVAYGEGLREMTIDSDSSDEALLAMKSLPPSDSIVSARSRSRSGSTASIRRLAASRREPSNYLYSLRDVDPPEASGASALNEQAVADLVRQGVREEMDAWVTGVLPGLVSNVVEQVIEKMLEAEDEAE